MTAAALTVYLAGEIHSDWREEVASLAEQKGVRAEFTSPVTDHGASDDCAQAILGDAPDAFWKDHASASVNAIRTRLAIRGADVVVVRFGEKYRQWNAAFDAGFASALAQPVITLHPEEHDHALKEVDAAALATARTSEQVVDLLRYVQSGALPGK